MKKKSAGVSSNRRVQANRIQIAVRCALLTSAVLQFAAAQAQSAAANGPDSPSNAAQSTDEVQEVVVTGVRAAISKALETKRDAQSIVDSISAEDIGKFPDDNIAEAVQRIPGVAIDRDGGEGRHISINGLGPDFSLTLFNGRQIASADTTRSFSFDTIAANLVSQVNVYKTANADTPEGGLGGTIDVRTARPFDYAGFKGSVQVSYLHDGNSGTGAPQAAFVLSDRFLDGRLGALVSFTHQKRTNKTYQTDTGGGWNTPNYFVDPVSHGYVADSNQNTWRAWNVHYGEVESSRSRDGGTAVVQFQATDTLTLTADYLDSKFTVDDVTNSGGAYLWAVQDTPLTIADSQGFYHQLDVSGGVCPGVSPASVGPTGCKAIGDPLKIASYLWQNNTTQRPTDTQLAGFNAEWKPSAKLKGVFDVYWSAAKNNDKGADTLQNIEMGGQPEYIVNFPNSGVPTFNLLGNNLASHPQDLSISQVENTGEYVEAINKGVQADFDFAPNEGTHFKFGASFNDQSKSDAGYETPSDVTELYHNGLGQPFPLSVLSGTTYAGQDWGLSSPFPIFMINSTALRAWMADPANLALRPGGSGDATTLAAWTANGSSFLAQPDGSAFTVDERDISTYGEISKDFHLGAVPANVVAGLRYSRTDLASSGTSQLLIGYTPNAQNAGNLQADYAPGGTLPITVKHDYGDFLPSLNAKFDLLPDLIYRASVSRTLTRPTLNDLAPTTSGFSGTVLVRNAVGYNPELKPFTSTNFDMSVEWYYSKDDALAIAGYLKNAKDFIVDTTEPELIPTITSPSAGVPLTLQQLQTTMVSRPRNAASAKVSGLTIGWTHNLPLGFGLQANYTKVSSSTSVDDGLPAFSMPGVSDTANVVLFYEKGRYSARIAYNWRSAFLVNPASSTTAAEYEDEYYQIDGRVGVTLADGFQLSASAINLTGSTVRWYSQNKNEFDALYNYGRQFLVTVSKEF